MPIRAPEMFKDIALKTSFLEKRTSKNLKGMSEDFFN